MNKECNTSEAFKLERLLKGNQNLQRAGLCVGQIWGIQAIFRKNWLTLRTTLIERDWNLMVQNERSGTWYLITKPLLQTGILAAVNDRGGKASEGIGRSELLQVSKIMYLGITLAVRSGGRRTSVPPHEVCQKHWFAALSSQAALSKVLIPASCSALADTWSTVSTSRLLTTRETYWTCWSKSVEGPWKLLNAWSDWYMGKGRENWDCSAWGWESSGGFIQCICNERSKEDGPKLFSVAS